MTARTDGALAAGVLLAFVVALALADASVSAGALAVGAAATIGFEAVAGRDPAPVRRAWRRPSVELAAILLALAVAVGGVAFAPSVVLSAGIGALVAYLLLLALVGTGRLGPPETWP